MNTESKAEAPNPTYNDRDVVTTVDAITLQKEDKAPEETGEPQESPAPIIVDEPKEAALGSSRTSPTTTIHDDEEEGGDSEKVKDKDEQQIMVTPEPLPRFYPHFRGQPVFYGNISALAWACTVVGQAAILIGIGAFIGPALVMLAKEEAGCETEPVDAGDASSIPECLGTVYGIKPSSLLTLMSSIVGVMSAIVIPIVGAVVDYTPHRRLIGRLCSGMYSLLILTLVFLNEDSWFALSFVLLIAVSVGWAQAMLFFAYLPEMTDDESRLNEFSKTFTVLIFSSMVVYLVTVSGISMGGGFVGDVVAVARCGSLVAFCLSAVLFYISWGLLFEERPAAHKLPAGQSLLGSGFRQVARTTKMIYKDYRALKWFYISICFGDAAIQSLSVIAITYITDQLQLSSQEVGAAALLMLLGSIPGALMGAWVNRVYNPIRSSTLAVFGMTAGTACAAIFLKQPGQQILTYFFAFIWGIGTGWKYTGDRVLAAAIVPAGQDAELMGFFMFCGQVFAWVPSLVFTVMNEAGVSQRIGLATLSTVFIGALFAYSQMGDYGDAIRVAGRLRIDTVSSATQQHAAAKADGKEESAVTTSETEQKNSIVPSPILYA